jgi:class 3 adenylate cyclase
MKGFSTLMEALHGFTQKYLPQTINKYFEMIIQNVMEHGGDVLKFAGDSIFVEWAVIEHGLDTIEECTAVAALCAASIAECCQDFPIFGADKTAGFLNVHCSLGVGDVAAVHIGDDRLRREFLLLGDPIDQVGFVVSCC